MGWINPATQTVQAIRSVGTLSSGSVAFTLTPGLSAQVTTLADVSNYASYDLSMYAYAQTPGTATSPIVVLVSLLWFDDTTSNIPVFTENWSLWCGSGPAVLNFGTYSDVMSATGPMHGRYMTVLVSYISGTNGNVIIQYYNLFGSPRVTTFSDWRQDPTECGASGPLSTVTNELGGFSGYSNTLAQYSFNTVANGHYFCPIALYAGQVMLAFHFGAAPQYMAMATADGIQAGDIWVNDPITVLEPTLNNSFQTWFIDAPRAPMYIAFTANAVASFFFCTVTAQQGI